MKKIILTLLILCSLSAQAQYKKLIFGKFTHAIECYNNKADFVSIKIKLASLDHNEVELIIGTQKEYDSFIERLNLYKTKFAEWDSVCHANNIDKIDKLIEFRVDKKEEPLACFGRHYNRTSMLSAFSYINGASSIVLHTGEVKAMLNKYITCKGGIIVFYSVKDIENLIEAFDLDNIRKYIGERDKTLNLLN